MIRPCFNRLSSAVRTVFDGMAKPIPCEPPLLETICLLMPTTSPRRLIKGPPLFPGLIAALVWSKSPREIRAVRLSLPADNSVSHCLLKTKRIANGENKISRLHRVGVSQLQRLDVRNVNLEHSQIELVVAPTSRAFFVRPSLNWTSISSTSIDHMSVGDNMAFLRHNHSRAK